MLLYFLPGSSLFDSFESLLPIWKFSSGLALGPDFPLGNPFATCRDAPYFDRLVQLHC